MSNNNYRTIDFIPEKKVVEDLIVYVGGVCLPNRTDICSVGPEMKRFNIIR